MREIPTFTQHDPIADIKDALTRYGAVSLQGLCEAKSLARQLNPYFQKAAVSDGAFYGYKTRRFSALIEKSPLCRELSAHPLILHLVQHMLSAHCDRIQLNLTQAIDIGPGEAPQFLHRDDDLFPFAHQFNCMVNVMWAVSDFTAENGATRIIPGSHTWPRDREPEVGETIAAAMPAGSCLIYLGSLFHAGGQNTTLTRRRGAVISYNLGWLRQGENFYLSVPWEKAKHYPTEVLRLMGYQLHRPNVGWVEGIDPLKWIEMGRPALCSAKDALTPEQIDGALALAAAPDAFEAYLT